MACSSPRKDHPRSCGANSRVLLHLAGSVGSSPLVRGQQLVARKHAFHERIIPARAGPTLPHRSHCMTVADHPRSCGANGIRGTFDTRGHGSSPLVRGQQTCGTWPRKRQRIIPARAGPTTSSDALTVFGTDHPRSCGANYSSPCTGRTGSGSSPLVRGQLASITRKTVSSRIIPARAGPTDVPSCRAALPPDHPRSCGANGRKRLTDAHLRGSSPLVRGQLPVLQLEVYGARIIPARAGPTKTD